MVLSQTAQYALRIMTSIAVTQGARPVCAKEIAQTIACSPPYVSKVLRKLVKAGLLRAARGHGGGFILARPAEKVFFCQILEAVYSTKEKKQCIFGWRRCDPKSPCILHFRWSAVSGTFEEWTKKTSLADIQRDASAMNWIVKGTDPNK